MWPSGVPGPMGPMGNSGPPGIPGENAPDPFRMSLNEPVCEFEWKGVKFIIPFDPKKYPEIGENKLTEPDIKFIQVMYPELFDKMVLFWGREVNYIDRTERFLK